MILPNLPAKLDKRTNQINRFLGLNWTENYQPGEYTDTLGLSTDDFPCLSQRIGISEVTGESAPTQASSVYEWGDHIFLVDGTKLLMDGDEIATVEAGTKQFAVVNKWLVVLPDNIMVDLEEGTVKQMSDPVSIPSSVPLYISNASQTQITSSSIKTTSATQASTGDPVNPVYPIGSDVQKIYTYFYGFDEDAVQACWDGTEWDWDALATLRKTVAINYDPIALDEGAAYADYPCPRKDMILIPDNSNRLVMATYPVDIDTSRYNNTGKYFRVNYDTLASTEPYEAQYFTNSPSLEMYAFADEESTVLTTVSSSDVLYYAGNANASDWAYLKVTKSGTDYKGYCIRDLGNNIRLRRCSEGGNWFGIYFQISGVAPFGEAFLHGGYKVQIRGTKYALYDKEGVVVSATPNKLTFADGTFIADDMYCYAVTEISLPARQYVFRAGYLYYTVTFTEAVKRGDVVYVVPSMFGTIDIWDPVKREVIKKYNATSSPSGTADKTMTLYSTANVDGVTILKVIPDLDYICESNNRVWGVSNDTKTIYASALGDPTDWWSTGLDDSSYQLVVSSEGDFTGIIEYGNAVLAWKEDSLTKILGGYPSQYYTSEYQYPGVQNYAAGTMQIINGVLYYKGVHGFYAYTSTPTLISPKLNGRNLYGGFGGSDGKKYYCSVYEGLDDSEYYVLVYDIEKGLWIKELDWAVDGYGYYSPEHLLYFISGGKMYWYDQTYNERVPWKAEFCPFIEGTSSNSVWTVLMGKKGYTKLILFCEMGEDAWVKFEIKEDNKPWKEIGVKHATHPIMFRQPIRLGRCARVQLRLTGKGKCMIRAINREYVAGSDK